MENNFEERQQYPPVQNQLLQSYPKINKKAFKVGKILTYFSYFLVGALFVTGFVIAGFFLGFSQGLSDKGKLEENLSACQMKAKSTPIPTPTPKPQILLSYADEKNNFLFDYPPKWALAKESDGPRLSIESAQLKFWVGVSKNYVATDSAKLKETKTISLDISDKQITAKEYTYQDGKLFLEGQLSQDPKVMVWLSSDSQNLYDEGKKIIQSVRFQRVSPF